MEKQSTLIIVGLLALVIGFSGGYVLRGNQSAPAGGHVMPNGSAMNDQSIGDIQGAMGSMMSGLQGKQGDDFDKAFLFGMITHHQGAVAMAEAALQSAKHPEIKQLAQNIISAQKGEIQEMQNWQKTWYGQQ